MRNVSLSITFNDQIDELLALGEENFDIRLTKQKEALVYETIIGSSLMTREKICLIQRLGHSEL
jgi:hypothetical protein